MDPDADSDDDALLVVRVSNPGDGGDGLRVYNRAAATDATLASLAVTIVDSGTVQVQLVVQAEAMQISPSPATKSY
jgi:hypothetical protein